MVNEYLEKLQNGFLKQKVDIEKKINELQFHLKEDVEFIKLLKENDDPNYAAFSPRESNSRNEKKIKELEEEKKSIEIQIGEEKKKYDECLVEIEELSEVMNSSKEIAVEQKFSNIDIESYRLAILETQENERQRISRELHDSTVQNLISMVHKVELCSKLVEMDPIRCKLELVTMEKTLREIINDTRQMIYNLRPMSFDDIGLDITIERALEKLENSEAKKIDFSIIGEPYEIKPVIGMTLLRIVQEACSNAIKHANSSLIKVILQYELNKILLTIEDDGLGFDVENVGNILQKDNSGFGLSMMKERVYLLSGNINIESRVNSGTKISVEVPIAK